LPVSAAADRACRARLAGVPSERGKRREFVEKLGIGSATMAMAAAVGNTVSADTKQDHDHSQIDGPLANATVSFGQWRTDPPLDRFPNISPRTANQHKLLPYTVIIKAGGGVNFNISGTHHILVYGPGTTLESIDASSIIEASPTFPGFVNDPQNRVYRGLDPRLLPQDRVEVVAFANRGTYLVVCGLLPHFLDRMHGFVQVN
jgi:hypothetical protein